MKPINSQEKFEKNFYEYAGLDYEVIGNYTGKDNPVMISHKYCQSEFPIIPNSYKRVKCLCPTCRHYGKSHDQFMNELQSYDAHCIPNELYVNQDHELLFTCTICNRQFRQTPKKLLNQLKTSNTPCPYCNKGISFPEKFFLSFLEQLDVKYIYQYGKSNGCDWCGNYRYDFYLIDYNIIIEIHGVQHYRETFSSLEVVKDNDKKKYQLAIEHGLKYIALDARKSTVKYISNSIMNSELSSVFDLSQIDWNSCGQTNRTSTFYKVCELFNEGKYIYKEIAEKCNISTVTVCRYVNEACRLGICDKKDGFRKKLYVDHNKSQPVRCIEDDIVFNSARDANEYFHRSRKNTSVYDCLHGKTKTAYGKHWEYVESQTK